MRRDTTKQNSAAHNYGAAPPHLKRRHDEQQQLRPTGGAEAKTFAEPGFTCFVGPEYGIACVLLNSGPIHLVDAALQDSPVCSRSTEAHQPQRPPASVLKQQPQQLDAVDVGDRGWRREVARDGFEPANQDPLGVVASRVKVLQMNRIRLRACGQTVFPGEVAIDLRCFQARQQRDDPNVGELELAVGIADGAHHAGRSPRHHLELIQVDQQAHGQAFAPLTRLQRDATGPVAENRRQLKHRYLKGVVFPICAMAGQPLLLVVAGCLVVLQNDRHQPAGSGGDVVIFALFFFGSIVRRFHPRWCSRVPVLDSRVPDEHGRRRGGAEGFVHVQADARLARATGTKHKYDGRQPRL